MGEAGGGGGTDSLQVNKQIFEGQMNAKKKDRHTVRRVDYLRYSVWEDPPAEVTCEQRPETAMQGKGYEQSR